MVKDFEDDVVIIDQLPSNSWFEGFVLRPNGKVLATRLDAPELYSFRGEDSSRTPEPVYDFSADATGLINLCPLEGCNDEYAVISGTVELANTSFANFILWRVAMSPDDSTPPKVTRLADLSETGLSVGVTSVSERLLLVADSSRNCIWRLDIPTGKLSVLVSDPSMKAASKDDVWGLNRVRVGAGHVWFTNSSVGTICRFPVELKPDDEEGIRATGPIELLASQMNNCDGLALTKDFSSAYLVNYLQGHLWKVDFDPVTGKGTVSIVRENLVSPTSVEYIDRDGESKIYIICCGEIEVGWINDENRSWSDLAHINATVTVTVTTTEEVVEAA